MLAKPGLTSDCRYSTSMLATCAHASRRSAKALRSSSLRWPRWVR